MEPAGRCGHLGSTCQTVAVLTCGYLGSSSSFSWAALRHDEQGNEKANHVSTPCHSSMSGAYVVHSHCTIRWHRHSVCARLGHGQNACATRPPASPSTMLVLESAERQGKMSCKRVSAEMLLLLLLLGCHRPSDDDPHFKLLFSGVIKEIDVANRTLTIHETGYSSNTGRTISVPRDELLKVREKDEWIAYPGGLKALGKGQKVDASVRNYRDSRPHTTVEVLVYPNNDETKP